MSLLPNALSIVVWILYRFHAVFLHTVAYFEVLCCCLGVTPLPLVLNYYYHTSKKRNGPELVRRAKVTPHVTFAKKDVDVFSSEKELYVSGDCGCEVVLNDDCCMVYLPSFKLSCLCYLVYFLSMG